MMRTKYGNIPDTTLIDYKKKLIGRVFKILPMKEEENKTLETYIESLLYELIGLEKTLISLKQNTDYISLIAILGNLTQEENEDIVKREVFKCLDLIKKF